MDLPFELTFAGGVLLGLASILHSAGMRGPIASGLLFSVGPNLAFGPHAKVLMVAQAGKSASYMAVGILLGLIGAGAYTSVERSIGFQVAQWAGAASLVWVGLSVAGLVPLGCRPRSALAPPRPTLDPAATGTDLAGL